MPVESWLNLYDLSPEDAAKKIRDTNFELGFFNAFAEAQEYLRKLFADELAISTERERLSSVILTEFRDILAG